MRTKYKGDWRYGRVEVRAKPPRGQGSFPAIWMLPTDNVYGGWPHSGEIDIFESVNLKTVNTQGVEEAKVRHHEVDGIAREERGVFSLFLCFFFL